MSTNPTSFRMPFQTQIANLPPEHQLMIRTIFNQLDDHLNAISVLKGQIETNKSAIATTNTIVNNTSSASETVIAQVPSETIGFVNDQSSQTAYTTNQTDYGKIIILDDASPIAVTLSTTGSVPGIIIPFFCAFLNLGAGVATLTPDAGNINNTTSETIPDGGFAIVYYDGTNTWAQIAANSAGTITDVVAGTGLTGGGSSGSVTLALATPVSIVDGGTGTASTLTGLVRGSASAMTAAEISGDGTTSGSNALTLATVNSNVGSYTNANITVNSKGLVTAAANGSSSGITIYQVSLIGSILAPGSGEVGATVYTAPSTAVLSASLYDPTSPGANEFLSAFAYNQNGAVSWSVFNVSSTPITVLSSTVLNIAVLT